MLGRNWDAIVESPEAGPLPVETGGVMEEYGCGAYGCVLRTRTQGTVLKITTDGSEAFFAQGAMELARDKGSWPPGIVEYSSVLALSEKYGHRPVFLLWREEAYNVGVLGKDPGLRRVRMRQRRYKKLAGPRSLAAFTDLLYDFMAHAGALRDLMNARSPARLAEEDRQAKWSASIPGNRPPCSQDVVALAKALERADTEDIRVRRVGWAAAEKGSAIDRLVWEVQGLYQVSEMMTKLVLGSSVGNALHYYLGKGMVLSDVHPGNVGEVGDDWDEARGDYADPDEWDFAITDPGNMVVISPQWLGLAVPMVSDLPPEGQLTWPDHLA